MRQAKPEDAPELARLIQQVWADHNPDPDRIARVIPESNHATWVEVGDSGLMGFVDSFSTLAQDGTLRWEIDLLGVRPDQQGRGVGGRLVQAAVASGRGGGAQIARALVRVDNAASLRVFERGGFTRGAPCTLYLCDQPVEAANVTPANSESWLLPVSTLTYSGVWIEAATSAGLQRAAAVRAHYRWNVAGAVIPTGQAIPLEGYESAGEYIWLTLRLG